MWRSGIKPVSQGLDDLALMALTWENTVSEVRHELYRSR